MATVLSTRRSRRRRPRRRTTPRSRPGKPLRLPCDLRQRRGVGGGTLEVPAEDLERHARCVTVARAKEVIESPVRRRRLLLLHQPRIARPTAAPSMSAEIDLNETLKCHMALMNLAPNRQGPQALNSTTKISPQTDTPEALPSGGSRGAVAATTAFCFVRVRFRRGGAVVCLMCLRGQRCGVHRAGIGPWVHPS